MKKINFNIDNKGINEYITSVQKEVPEYIVDITNVNDFSILLEERKNCKYCNSLSECKNKNYGHYTIFKDDCFSLVACEMYKALEQRENLIQTLYLPQKILDAKIEDYYTNSESRKKIYSSMINFITNYDSNKLNKGLYLFGGFSLGKTYTLATMANELAKKNISCLLIFFPDLVSDLKSAISTPRYTSLINMLKEVDVLMLDDLGSENMTPWLRDDVLGPILNYRLLENKSVFISSNISPSNLVNHLSIDKTPESKLKGERIVSRLHSLVVAISMDDCEKIKR